MCIDRRDTPSRKLEANQFAQNGYLLMSLEYSSLESDLAEDIFICEKRWICDHADIFDTYKCETLPNGCEKVM